MTETSISSIGLADAIQTLRAELAEAIRRGEGEALRFKIDGIDLELSVACEINGNGKASFKVLGIGAEISAGGKMTNTHKVKLSLKPTDGHGNIVDTLVSSGVDDFPD